jgi:hypothetical protein
LLSRFILKVKTFWNENIIFEILGGQTCAVHSASYLLEFYFSKHLGSPVKLGIMDLEKKYAGETQVYFLLG